MEVTGKLARPDGGGIFVDDFKFLKSVARVTPKITLPSPTVMHFRGGRAAIDAGAYPDIADFYDDLARLYREEIADLARAGCRYLQLDEVNLAYLCDGELRKQVANIGEDPAHKVGHFDIGLGGDLTKNEHETGSRGGFAGDSPLRVVREHGVENSVRYLVADFVRVAFADRLGGEDEIFAHELVIWSWTTMSY